jgi:exodeoxyribonuclease V
MTIDLTTDQKHVLDSMFKRLGFQTGSQSFFPDFSYVTIGGYAGTGKTFLISVLRKSINEQWKDRVRVAFVTFTGKASSVLQRKLQEQSAIYASDYCGTIHSLIYKPIVEYNKKTKKLMIVRWERKKDLEFDLIILDEASMVNLAIWKDLSFYKIPIIAVGDHGQLPPIGDKFNLMGKPQYILTEIKRQTLENPIIRMSQDIRNGIDIPYGFYDQKNKDVFKLSWNSSECKQLFNKLDYSTDDIIVLCALNKTRVTLNKIIRDKMGFTSPDPYPGDRIVFLRNNNQTGILNGMLGQVMFMLWEGKNIYNMSVKLDYYEEPYGGLVFNGCFGQEKYEEVCNDIHKKEYQEIIQNSQYKAIDLCDWGYCISAHKSQGSEFKRVVCFVEKSYYWDSEYMKKWLYTAVTRAKEKLFLITP